MDERYWRCCIVALVLMFVVGGLPSLSMSADQPKSPANGALALAGNSEDPEGSSEHGTSHEGELASQHRIILAFGYTYVAEGADDAASEKGVFVPSLGLGYFYRLDHKWEVGLEADMEFAHYLILDKDLDRKNAVILVGLASYEVMPFWAVFAGGGIELEQHENLPVFRVGTEYEFQIRRDWSIGPALLFDHKMDFATWSISVVGGRRF